MERDQNIQIETLALSSATSDRQHAGARSPSGRGPRPGKARFEQFVEQLGRHLRGRSLVRDVVEELYPEPVRMDDAAALAEAQERAS